MPPNVKKVIKQEVKKSGTHFIGILYVFEFDV